MQEQMCKIKKTTNLSLQKCWFIGFLKGDTNHGVWYMVYVGMALEKNDCLIRSAQMTCLKYLR